MRDQLDCPAVRRTVCALALLALLALLAPAVTAQTSAKPLDPPPPQDPASQIVETVPPRSPAELQEAAWTLLTNGMGRKSSAEVRVQALAALGLLGSNARSLALIRTALADKDIDIRIAAVVAAGQTRSIDLASDLRSALDDKEPAVAFAAALTLWKLHDRSGEDILTAVADGERTTTSKFINGTEHTISKELHNPAALARYGATQGAYTLLGPFGIGLTAYEYLHKNGGDASRVSAIDAIAQNHTTPIHAELVSALKDKDVGVRAAAAKALARYHEADVPPALGMLFEDTKVPVRLTAAAAYLISSGALPGSPAEGEVALQPTSHTPRRKPAAEPAGRR